MRGSRSCSSIQWSPEWNLYFSRISFWKLLPDFFLSSTALMLLSVYVNDQLWSSLSDADRYHVSISSNRVISSVDTCSAKRDAHVKVDRKKKQTCFYASFLWDKKLKNSHHQNITFHLLLFTVASVAFHTSLNGRDYLQGINDLAGACQKLLGFFFGKKTHSAGIIVSQEAVFLMVKYKSLIAVCHFTT